MVRGTPKGHLLVLIGGLAPRHRDRVRQFALRLNAPVYAETISGLREDRELDHLLVRNERMLSRGGFDGLIRIGNVPTVRFWRDLADNEIEVAHYSDLPFTGLPRGELRPIDQLPLLSPTIRDDQLFTLDRQKAAELARILDEEPQSELAMMRSLSEQIPKGARIYLGNSLPIREWDLVATREPHDFSFEANRGANGIDGQLSTFFGWCKGSNNWCIVGDLTALYDLNAPWIAPQLQAEFNIVIINNGGGRIFSRVPSLQRIERRIRETLIENAHTFRFASWAAMWGIGDRVTELLPDAAASQRVWERYDALWA